MTTITLTTPDVTAINRLRRSPFGDAIRAVVDKQLVEHRRVFEAEPANESLRAQLDLTKTVKHLLFEATL